MTIVPACELADASPIHFAFSGTATNSIGGTSGTAPVTFSFDADTSNVTFDATPVPEPSSFALFSVALVGMVSLASRKSQRNNSDSTY